MGQSGSATTVRCLSFHATYRCGHTGECCTARWPIPIEADALARVRAAFVNAPHINDPGGDSPVLLPLDAHGCAFHNTATQRCEIHAALGHDALPLACRQFPRVSVTDPRGVSVALSCYCPTALGMLETFAGEIAIVEHPPAFPSGGEYAGLDARTSLPPALCPDVLMDWDSWWEWERLSVELCNRDDTPRQILARLSVAVETVRTWRPADGDLIDRVREAHARARTAHPAPRTVHQHPARRNSGTGNLLLASHAFASWPALLGSGLRTWLRSLETVVFLMEVGWTIREIDLWLRHFADPRLLAKAWSAAERA